MFIIFSLHSHSMCICIYVLYFMAHPTYILCVITLVVNGISKVSPLITGVIGHLLSGINGNSRIQKWRCCTI